MARVLVVGFGNDLAGDDGAGLSVVRQLVADGACSNGLRAVEGHTDALRLPSFWNGEPEVWLVDAVERGSPPGTIHRLEHEELLAVPQRHGTAHQLSLPECLRWIALAYPEMAGVRYRLWGIEPERIALKEGLSEAVEVGVEVTAGEIEDVSAVTGPACPTDRSRRHR